MDTLFDKSTIVTPAILNTIAHLPTSYIPNIIDESFWQNMSDTDFMRIAVLLATKNYEDGEYPIGALIIDNDTRKIVGQSHKAFDQEDHPYNHGAKCAVHNAGPIDFSKTTMFITFNPCDVCTTVLRENNFSRVVIGDTTNTIGNEHRLKEAGITVDIIEDQTGVDLYRKYKEQHSLSDNKQATR